MSPDAVPGDESLADLTAPLRAAPERAAVLCDIDGTLAPIVHRPQDAAVPNTARGVLRRLAGEYGLVACVSGRAALDARRLVGVDGIVYAGNHGFETLQPGEDSPASDPAVGARRDRARAFVAELDAGELQAAGLQLEDKGVIQALHWRGAADPAEAHRNARKLADAARAAGLVPRWGRKVLELRPVAGIDKGSAVGRLVRERGAQTALFGGDDETDLDGFRALRWMQRSGRLRFAACIGVGSDEAPDGLAEATDLVVEGTDGFLDVLRALADSPG